jgi:hypothetical protein
MLPCAQFEVEWEKLDLVSMEGFRCVVPRAAVSVVRHYAAVGVNFAKKSDEFFNNQWELRSLLEASPNPKGVEHT